MKKIAIIGPESTGKSTLSQQLAKYFNTQCVPEYARYYLNKINRPYQQTDLLAIARKQVKSEDETLSTSNNYLFCDTNLLVLKIWSDYKYGSTNVWIENKLRQHNYFFNLLCNIDIAWQPDLQREHPNQRKFFFDKFEYYLKNNQLPYAIISGKGALRCENAILAIQRFEQTQQKPSKNYINHVV